MFGTISDIQQVQPWQGSYHWNISLEHLGITDNALEQDKETSGAELHALFINAIIVYSVFL